MFFLFFDFFIFLKNVFSTKNRNFETAIKLCWFYDVIIIFLVSAFFSLLFSFYLFF